MFEFIATAALSIVAIVLLISCKYGYAYHVTAGIAFGWLTNMVLAISGEVNELGEVFGAIAAGIWFAATLIAIDKMLNR